MLVGETLCSDFMIRLMIRIPLWHNTNESGDPSGDHIDRTLSKCLYSNSMVDSIYSKHYNILKFLNLFHCSSRHMSLHDAELHNDRVDPLTLHVREHLCLVQGYVT